MENLRRVLRKPFQADKRAKKKLNYPSNGYTSKKKRNFLNI